MEPRVPREQASRLQVLPVRAKEVSLQEMEHSDAASQILLHELELVTVETLF